MVWCYVGLRRLWFDLCWLFVVCCCFPLCVSRSLLIVVVCFQVFVVIGRCLFMLGVVCCLALIVVSCCLLAVGCCLRCVVDRCCSLWLLVSCCLLRCVCFMCAIA